MSTRPDTLTSAVKSLLFEKITDVRWIEECCLRAGGLALLPEQLAERGIATQRIEVSHAEVRYISLPAVVACKFGFVTLVKRGLLHYRGYFEGVRIRVGVRALREQQSGEALELLPEAGPESAGRALAWGAFLASGQAFRLFLFAAATAILTAILPSFLIRFAVDAAVGSWGLGILVVLAAGCAALAALNVLAAVVRDSCQRHMSAFTERNLRRWSIEALFGREFLDLQRKSVSEHTRTLATLDQLRASITDVLVPMSLDAVLAAAILLALLLIDAQLAALLGLASALLLAISAAVARRQVRENARRLLAESAQVQLLQEVMRSIETVKAMAVEERMHEEWRPHFDAERRAKIGIRRFAMWSEAAFSYFPQIGALLALLWSGRLALEGEGSAGLTMASAFLAALASKSLARVCRDVPRFWGTWELGRGVSLERQSREQSTRPRGPLSAPAEVLLDGVSFRYSNDLPWILRNQCLRVPAGGWCRLPGASGTGKSTTLRLMAGLLTPQEGVVRVGETDVRSALHDIYYLPQRPQLLQGSIWTNLQLYSGWASTSSLRAAAKATGLDELVRRMPMGFETILPQGGGCLSGGERQLVFLTACVAVKARVLLLDEAFANLDPATRERLRAANLFRGRTVIFADHDPGDSLISGPGLTT
jgi:ATP-binding cassette, subfamily B, bacterial